MSPRQRRITTIVALLLLAVAALSVGVTATIAPKTFYDGYPFFAHWIDLLPPYNKHLTTDVGEFELAFGILFVWAAWRPEPALVIPVCLTWALSQALHTLYHVMHLQHFSTTDALAQTVSLLYLTALPLLPATLCRPQPRNAA